MKLKHESYFHLLLTKNIRENKVAFIGKERNAYIEIVQSQVYTVQVPRFLCEFFDNRTLLSIS